MDSVQKSSAPPSPTSVPSTSRKDVLAADRILPGGSSLRATENSSVVELAAVNPDAAIQKLLDSADTYRKKNEFDAAVDSIKSAIKYSKESEQTAQLHLKLARIQNGAGAFFLARENKNEADTAYKGAQSTLQAALGIATENNLGLFFEKSVVLQQYFNATGMYKINPNENLNLLVSIRKKALATFESTLNAIEEGNADVSAVRSGELVDPEVGVAKVKIATLKHELAFLLDDRPEEEIEPLDEDRKSILERSVELYTEALEGREGSLRAMTFSRRLSPTYKLGGLTRALPDLDEAVQLYIQDPDGQRLDILGRDIQGFLSAENITAEQRVALNNISGKVDVARECLSQSSIKT